MSRPRPGLWLGNLSAPRCLESATTAVCYSPHLLGLLFSCLTDSWSVLSWSIYLPSFHLFLGLCSFPSGSFLTFMMEARDGRPCSSCFYVNSHFIIGVSEILRELNYFDKQLTGGNGDNSLHLTIGPHPRAGLGQDSRWPSRPVRCQR